MKTSINIIDAFRTNTKTVSIVCMCISVFSRTINVLYFSYVGGDKMTTALMSRSLLRGDGLSIPQYFVSNPDLLIHNTTPLWPPGYPLLLAGFLKIFNYDLFWASTAIDLIAAIALIFIIRKFCIIIGLTPMAVNFATLIAGCFNYSFISLSQPTDTVTLTLLFLGYYFIVKVLIDNSIKKSSLITASFFLVLAAFFRYSYHLSILILLVGILITGYLLKNKILIKKGKTLFISAVLFYSFFALIQFFITGSLLYSVPTQKGIFLNNLWPWASFIPASFISLNFLYTRILSVFLDLSSFDKLNEVVNFLGIVTLATLFVLLLFKYKAFKTITPFKWFVLTGAFITSGIILLLIYASLTNREQVYHGVPWNYLRETRYFGFITILIQIAFIGWCFSDKKLPFKHPIVSIIKYVLVFLVFLELIHNIYFNAKLLFEYKQYKQEHYWQTRFRFLEDSIISLINNNPDKDILVAAYTHPTAPQIAAYYGQKGLVDILTLNSSLPPVNKPTLLIVYLFDNELPLFKSLFEKAHPVLYSRNEYDNIYLVELRP